MTSNYEQMTDDELREEVADRLGWINLDWDDNTLFGDNPSGMLNPENTPNWPQDCNAALALLRQTGYALWSNSVEWEIQDMANGKAGKPGYCEYAIPIITSHINPGRAICIAWLLWQDVQEAK